MSGDRILLWCFIAWTALFGIWPWLGHPTHHWSDGLGSQVDLAAHATATALLAVIAARRIRR